MSEENNGASNFIWAFALVVIVAIIAGAFYYSGALRGGNQKHDVDIEIKAPTR